MSVAMTFLARALFWVHGVADSRVQSTLREALELADSIQSHYAAGHALATLGDVTWARGDTGGAVTLWRRALGVVCELDDRRGIAGCLERLALVVASRGQLEQAAWLFGAADAQHTALGIGRRADDAVDHAHFVAANEPNDLRASFGDAWAEGQAASVEASIQRAFELTAS